MMSRKIALAPLSLTLCFACGAVVRAQVGRGEPPPPVPPCALQQPLSVGKDVSTPRGWKRYEIQYCYGNVLQIVLPASPPETKSQSIPVGNYPPATYHMFMSTDESGFYLVGYLEGLPVKISNDRNEQAAFFAGLWKGFAAGVSDALKEKGVDWSIAQQPQREMMISGFHGQTQDFTIGKFAGSARAVIGDGHAYVIVTFSHGESLSAESTLFLDSFNLRATH